MSKRRESKNYIRLRDPNDTLVFGRLVAEQDDNLAQYYVAPERFAKRAGDIQDPAVFFVGPKGIGKSAILQMVRLAHHRDQRRIIDIRPDDLAFSALANAEATSPLLSDASRNQWLFKVLWDYVLCLEVFRREFPEQSALASFFSSLTQGQHEKEARKLLELSRADNAASLTERILQLIKEVEISGEYAGARLEAKATLDSSRRSAKDDSLRLLSLVNSSAKRLPDSLRSEYFVLIDDLDLHWVNSPTQNSFIAALFTSLRHFSRPPGLKCVVALRDNIYRALPLVDPDKFHDAVCEVSWDLPTLQKMLEARIEFKLNIARSDIWGGLFPDDAIHSIWMNSDARPREAIRLANLAVSLAAENGHPAVSKDDLGRAIKKFSDERLREVASEWQFKLPGLEYFLRRMSGWPKEFPLSRFRELLELVSVEIQLKEPGSEKYEWLYGFAGDPRGLARILIEHDILLWKAGRTDRAIPYDPKNYFEVNEDSWLAIHPMFGAGLGLMGA